MEINRGVQNIRRENEQEGDFSSKLHEKEKTVWRFEFDSANLFSSNNQQPTTNNLTKNHHRYINIIAPPLRRSSLVSPLPCLCIMPLLYYMMPAEPFR